MSDERRWLGNWKTAVAVTVGGIAAVAGVSFVTYKILQWKRGGRRSETETGESPEASEGESVGPTTGRARSENGGFIAPGERGLTKSVHERAMDMAHERAMDIKQEGNNLYKTHKFAEAVKCYKDALELCPLEKKDDISKLYQNIGAAYAAMASQATDEGEKTEHLLSVVDYCTRAVDENKRYVKALTRRLKAYEALGMKHEALLDVTRVVIIDESQAIVMRDTIGNLIQDLGKEQAARDYPTLGPLPPTDFIIKTYVDSFVWNDDLSEERLMKLWQSHYENTVEAEGESKGFSEEPFVRAAAMFRDKNYQGILEVLSEAVERGSPVFHLHALLLRATFYMLWRENRKAMPDLDAVINDTGASKELITNALVKKATIYAGIPELEQMKACFDRCFELDKNCVDALIHKARVRLETLEDIDGMDNVVEWLTKAISLAPQSAYAQYSLATAYHRIASLKQSQETLKKAMTTFESAVEKFPEYGDGLILYATYLQDVSQISKAKAVLEKVQKLEPNNPSVYLTLGIVSILSSDPNKARGYFEKAIEVDQSCTQAYETLASLELQAGNTVGALDLYRTAARFTRSQMELSEVVVKREMIAAQHQACQEYGVSVKDLMARAFQSPFM